MILPIIIAIFGFSFLILIHELGHFFVAKKTGMAIEEFGVGFPPRIWAKKSKKTGIEYSINWIPFGGFVKIKGEDDAFDKNAKFDKDSFTSKPIPKRMLVISAGVAMNLLFAIIILSIVNFIGVPSAVDDSEDIKNPQVQILEVVPDAPAAIAGMQAGDIIKYAAIGTERISIFKTSEIASFSDRNRGKTIELSILRNGEEKTISIIPRESFPEGQGAMGVSLMRIGLARVPWNKALVEGVKTTWEIAKMTVFFLAAMVRDLFLKGNIPSDVAGPVGIIAMSGKIANMGVNYVLWIFAAISINLFLINLLPIPALDGGRLLFLFIEWVKGSPVSRKIEQSLHYFGFILLLVLMVLITIRDVVRLF